MSKKNNRKPKQEHIIALKKVPSNAPQNNPDNVLDKSPSWKFGYLNGNYPWNPFEIKEIDTIKDILEKLRNFETMKWKEIENSKNHRLSYDSVSKEAKKELDRIGEQEAFSFRLTGPNRLIGIRRNETFYIIWWDPDHKFCPSRK